LWIGRLHQTLTTRLNGQNTSQHSHPKFISGSDKQNAGILKQVQDDQINDFLASLIKKDQGLIQNSFEREPL